MTKLVKHRNLRPVTARATLIDTMNQVLEQPAQLVRIGVLAKLTGVSISYLRTLADAGLIPACRVGPGYHRRFPRDEAVQRVREVIQQQW